MDDRRVWFLLGLFLTTLASLTLEILDTRLLSVLTWYHLSFFAVSIAMFGMAAGAVQVYLGGERFEHEAAVEALARYGNWFAISIAVSHLANLSIPIPVDPSPISVVALVLAAVVLSVPFYISGVLVSICLTRIPGKIGLVYAVDLLGASLGSLLILPLLTVGNITTTAFACAALAALGAACFSRFAGRSSTWAFVLAVGLVALAVLNSATLYSIRLIYPKGEIQSSANLIHESWSIHGQVMARQAVVDAPFYWGPGIGADGYEVERIEMVIDGAAGTSMTRWDGESASLAWVQHDVTSLPYHLRRGGDAGVIGVGGGRDLLTALWGESRSVVGVEINQAFVELLEGPLREFANLATQPQVSLVHDEARSYLTRTDKRFDVLQMSLIDTWAATGAGAFTLSENGLYTVEAWDVFLRTLRPAGIFSVSRWYAPGKASETSRLVALATAALLRNGVEDPARNLALVARKRVATLMVSNEPFTDDDLAALSRAVERFGFEILLAPGHDPSDQLLGSIAASRSVDEVLEVVRDEPYNYTPPTDEQPYFFNLIRPSRVFAGGILARGVGVVRGNMVATATLMTLMAIVTVLVAAVIFGPLLRSGLPKMDGVGFALAVLYFGLIGSGFMLIQIGFMQRFSVYLGHPTYAVAVILFSMILATGIGSYISDRVPVEESDRWIRRIPLLTAGTILIVSLLIQTVVEGTIHLGLTARCIVVIALVTPVSLLLGMFFPIGMRLVERLSPDAMPWMWGVNGACGVLASVAAVAISMWMGIAMTLYLALVAYGILVVPATILWRKGAAEG